MYKIGLNNFKGGGVGLGGRGGGGVGLGGRGGGGSSGRQSLLWLWGAFCPICIFHNQKMHFYLILSSFYWIMIF